MIFFISNRTTMFRKSCTCHLRSAFFPPWLSVYLACTASLLSTGKNADTQGTIIQAHTYSTDPLTEPCVIYSTVFHDMAFNEASFSKCSLRSSCLVSVKRCWAIGLSGVSFPRCYHGTQCLSNQTVRLCLQMTVDSLMFQGFELIFFSRVGLLIHWAPDLK